MIAYNLTRVYSSTDISSNKTYAVKIFKNEEPKKRDFSYNNEMKIMNKLSHQNIIQLIDVSEEVKILSPNNPN
jgi:serine/threonine protein kinase